MNDFLELWHNFFCQKWQIIIITEIWADRKALSHVNDLDRYDSSPCIRWKTSIEVMSNNLKICSLFAIILGCTKKLIKFI